MNRQSTQKEGKRSSAQKMASTRHPFETAPSTSPTPGAFGKEAEPVMPDGQTRKNAQETERQVRRLAKAPQDVTKKRRT